VIVRVPRQFMLWAPRVGPIVGCVGLSSGDASLRLMDRVANGAAFPGERVRPLKVHVTIASDGGVTGFVVPTVIRGGVL
jgi:hypothetical protein